MAVDKCPGSALLLIALVFLSSIAVQGQPVAQQEVKTPQPAFPAAVDQLTTRIKELISHIEYKPPGIVMNREYRVLSEPGRPRYHQDGTYNHDFQVQPDHSAAAPSEIIPPEDRRMEYTRELIRIGKPAVPELMLALGNEAYEFREYYCFALGQIKDLRATPALLHYYQDGVEQLKMAKSIRMMGEKEWAAKVEQRGQAMKDQALLSLRQLTGKDFGDDLLAWERWWESVKDQVGPIPPLSTYTVNPGQPSTPPAAPRPTEGNDPQVEK